MSDDYLLATTQYNDLAGTVSVDGWSGPPLHDIAKAIGIDTDQYWPINIHFYAAELVRNHPFFHVAVDVVDKSLFGSSFDDLQRYMSEREGKVQAVRFTRTKVDLIEVLKPVKRLSIALRRPDLQINELDVVEEIDVVEDEEKA